MCYRFAAADEDDTHAVQVEAVRDDGARVLFATQGKRPSVKGSRFESGARVFVARAGGPDVHVCESVVDSLSVASRSWSASRAAVIASAGTSGLTASAVSGWPGAVTIFAQGDAPVVRCELPASGTDWADAAHDDAAERLAIEQER